MTTEELSNLIDLVNGCWPRSEPYGAEVVAVLAPAAEPVSPDAGLSALRVILDGPAREFPPHPSEILELAREISGLSRPIDFDEAIGEILRQASKVGSWGRPTWSSPDIELLVANSGGWRRFCATEEEDLPVVKAQMRRMWDAIQRRRRVAESVERQVLAGLPDPRPHGTLGTGSETKAIGGGE